MHPSEKEEASAAVAASAGVDCSAELLLLLLPPHTQVVVFSKTYCPYCIKAKKALGQFLQPNEMEVVEVRICRVCCCTSAREQQQGVSVYCFAACGKQADGPGACAPSLCTTVGLPSWCCCAKYAPHKLVAVVPALLLLFLQLDNLSAGDNIIDIQDALGEVTGARSVPRVFVGGKFIGGGDDTVAKAANGELKELLVAVGACKA